MVVDEPRNGSGDVFVEFYDTLGKANYAAEFDWEHLNKWGKKRSHIFVAWVERDNSFIDEDELNNNEWWEYYYSFETNKYCFDSAKLVEE